MDIDVPDSHQAGEATAQPEQPQSIQATVVDGALEASATASGIVQSTPPTTTDVPDEPKQDPKPPNKHCKQHTPQFSAIASTVLQRMNQSRESRPTATSASATMPMPAPSQLSQPSLEQPLVGGRACSVCAQASSSLFNPLVQCRRCLGHWHRLCYKPSIPDFTAASSASSAFSASSKSKWACLPCDEAASASRQKRLQQRAHNTKGSHLKIEPPSFLQRAAVSKAAQSSAKGQANAVSWSHRPLDDRRAHVASLAPREMAYWLLRAVEQYPDFAMFPEDVQDEASERQVMPAPASAATEERVVARPPQYRNGIINSIRKSQALAAPTASPSTAPIAAAKVPRRVAPQTIAPSAPAETPSRTRPLFEATRADPDDDPTGLMDGWPRPGRGMYAAAGPDWLVETAALADSSDHLSFSSMVYDESGRKVRENGMPLLVYSV